MKEFVINLLRVAPVAALFVLALSALILTFYNLVNELL